MKKIIANIVMMVLLVLPLGVALPVLAITTPETIHLAQKDITTWNLISGGLTADVTYSTDVNGKFSATWTGVPMADYTLVYYPDTGTYTGEVYPVIGTNMNLPMTGDTNSPGAKLWLIPNADISGTVNADGSQTLVGDWNTIAPNFLFDTGTLMNYTATPVTHTQKNLTTWVPILPGKNADVTYSTVAGKFHATGVPDGYTLVYYPNVGDYNTYTGEVYPVEGTNMNLPMANDLNGGSSSTYCTNGSNPNAGTNCEGAKLWLVPSGDVSGTINTDGSQTLLGDWNTIAPNIMFETGLMTYTATPPTPLTALNLLTAGNFTILSKTGITDTGSHASHVVGDIGSSAITSASISVFCSEISGKIYGVDAAYVGSGDQSCFNGNPPLANKTLVDNAVSDMQIAYTNAAGLTNPTATELGAGDIGGMTLAPGLYKWSNNVTIPTNVTLSGGPNDVWVFQIAGDLDVASKGDLASGIKVLLTGGAKASNVFWQVGGETGATLGTYSTFNGTILSAKQIIIQTGAVLNGRALAQTQVTLDSSILNPSDAYVITNPATAVTSTDAMLNGLNGPAAGLVSFWVSLSPSFDTSTSNIPAGVYSTPVLNTISANGTFSAPLSLVTTQGIITGGQPGNLPAITPGTTYYYVAWSNVGGTWYPGQILSFTTATIPVTTTILVSNLQPSWTATGGGGVWAAYYAPDSETSGGVSPGSTAVFDGREAGIIKAGITPEPSGSNVGHYMDEGLLAFQVNNVNLSTFASQALTYDVQNQTGTNPVWVRIRLVGGTQYQFIPTTNPAGWHTVNAADGQWQLMDNNGNGVGSLMTLSQVATANSGAQVDRVYLTLGMGDSYNVSSGVGTVAWVDTVTIGGTTYNFVTAPPTSPTTFIVTIEKYIDGVPASTTPATTAFQMNQAYTIDSTLGSNPYTLSPSGAGSSNIPYEAITSPLDANSTYTTNEVTGAESPVGADCTANNPYSLVGYSTGGTLADAVTAEQSLTPPSFTDLTQNEYVIVWNHDCSKPTITGTVTSGPGVLHVDSITSNPMNANGIADGSYANGWKYVFHITTPTNEPNFAMSFANWLSGANILPVAGNMRIFSLQSASNTTEGSAIPIVAANTLTTPMVITSDLDAGTAGRQIDVTVEVKIPTGTVNGSYSTSYGVQTLP